jgi:hypothetical protein
MLALAMPHSGQLVEPAILTNIPLILSCSNFRQSIAISAGNIAGFGIAIFLNDFFVKELF